MKRILPILCALCLTACGTTTVQETAPSETAAANTAEMTLEEKVGQLFMVRCDSENMDALLEKQPGGIVMFGIDFQDLSEDEVKNKIQSYKDACRIEPIIAVDEEGGTVVRVSSNPQLAPQKYESPQYYYNAGGLDAVNANTAEKSELLKSLGITMNLAPVVDVSTDPEDFIYDRALGAGAQETAEYAAATVSVMHEHRLMSCLKHFPGYGSNADTHTGIAIDERPLETFEQADFLPFKSGISQNTDAILVSHNIIKSVDEVPASISEPIHRILRDDLHFENIIMTDDMSMDAMKDYDTPYIRAVLAGNDMIIVTDFDAAYNEILSAVKNGEIPEETIDAAVNRIVNLKKRY